MSFNAFFSSTQKIESFANFIDFRKNLSPLCRGTIYLWCSWYLLTAMVGSRDHSGITSSKRWVGGIREWQFLMIYSTVNHQRGGRVGQKHDDVTLEWSPSKRDSTIHSCSFLLQNCLETQNSSLWQKKWLSLGLFPTVFHSLLIILIHPHMHTAGWNTIFSHIYLLVWYISLKF